MFLFARARAMLLSLQDECRRRYRLEEQVGCGTYGDVRVGVDRADASLWAVADALPGVLKRLLHCRACGEHMGMTDLCKWCADTLWTAPCEECSSMVGKRAFKRRCVAHTDWELRLDESGEYDE